VQGFPAAVQTPAALSVVGIQLRQLQTSAVQSDIDQAAKYIGAGAATVGVAGSGFPALFYSQMNSISASGCQICFAENIKCSIMLH